MAAISWLESSLFFDICFRINCNLYSKHFRNTFQQRTMRFSLIVAGLMALISTEVTEINTNLIKNGDFTSNFLSDRVDWAITNSLPYWQIPKQIQQGIGSIYNRRWGSKFVVELDGYYNDILKQHLDLQAGQYIFSLDYAARSGYFVRSNMSIFWNGHRVKYIQANDEEIHTLQIQLTAVAGRNTIEIRGQGKINGMGMTVSHIKLVKAPSQVKSLNKIEINKNLLSNGEFQNPSRSYGREWITQLQGWNVSFVQHGYGYLWNKRWQNRNVIQLSQDLDDSLKQTIDLKIGQYRFEVQHADTEESTINPSFSVRLNGQQIFKKSISNKEIGKSSFSFNVSKAGSFDFEIKNQKYGGRLTIGKICVLPLTTSDQSSVKVPCPDRIEKV